MCLKGYTRVRIEINYVDDLLLLFLSFALFTSGAMAFSAGDYLQTCALLTFGGVYCWGNNDYGQLGTNDTTERLVPTAVMKLVKGNVNYFLEDISQCFLKILVFGLKCASPPSFFFTLHPTRQSILLWETAFVVSNPKFCKMYKLDAACNRRFLLQRKTVSSRKLWTSW